MGCWRSEWDGTTRDTARATRRLCRPPCLARHPAPHANFHEDLLRTENAALDFKLEYAPRGLGLACQVSATTAGSRRPIA
jgi:hypothetical protein